MNAALNKAVSYRRIERGSSGADDIHIRKHCRRTFRIDWIRRGR
jgi:hypothetical protein